MKCRRLKWSGVWISFFPSGDDGDGDGGGGTLCDYFEVWFWSELSGFARLTCKLECRIFAVAV